VLTKVVTISIFLVFFSFGLSRPQDPGIADTVRLANISGEISDKIAMPVFLYNDEELTSVVIPLLIDGYSGWLKFDSVSYVDSRLTNPAILDNRLTYVFASDTFTVDSLLLSFSVSSGNNLPTGSGKLCDLWFTLYFGGGVLLDSLSSSPQGGLSLTDASQGTFSPQFSSGLIDIACNYLVGDCTRDDHVDVGDVVMHHKIYFYDESWSGYPVQNRAGRFDLNCDRRLDMRDLNHLVDFLMFNGPSTCTCGTINPSFYHDPGLSDTVWVESDTLIAGIPASILVGIVNDEPLTGLAVNLEWDGGAVLTVDLTNSNFTDRLDTIFWNANVRHANANGVNPDTFQFYGWRTSPESIALLPGRGPVITITLTPQSPGEADFQLVSWRNKSQSLLVTEDRAAVLPVFSGGHITVLPYLTGDASHDGVIDIGDVVYLINYLYKNGVAPDPLESGDANCDSVVDVSDVVFLINYLFKDGPAPSC
jgi:hypothetical protein